MASGFGTSTAFFALADALALALGTTLADGTAVPVAPPVAPGPVEVAVDTVDVPFADGSGTAVGATVLFGGGGSRPTHAGRCQITTAIPHAVEMRSIAMNATSFCFVVGPRGRTTTVGVFGRRGFSGRSGMRIVI